MPTAAPTLVRHSLRESAGQGGRVDREAGVVRGVKLLGRVSPNTHGVKGARSTEYTDDAFRSLLEHAEARGGVLNCNAGHPPRNDRNQEPPPERRTAWLENLVVESGKGAFGDLHFLNPASDLAVSVMNAAENNPRAFALSINGTGEGEVTGGRYVVHRLSELRSVDLVCDGGTNVSLFESAPMKVKVCEVLRGKVLPALKKGRAVRLLRLLEDDSMSMTTSPVMEEGDEGMDHRDHMYKAMRACEEAGDGESAEKIHKLLGPPKKDAAGNEEDMPADEPAAKPVETKESLERGRRRVKSLGSLAGVEVSADLAESLCRLDADAVTAALVAIKKASGTAPNSGAPRSAPRGGVNITESRQTAAPASAEDFAKLVLR